ncbi:hypothetical protein B0H21DRAFT_740272 [Amylocystis lapponica]|nr:hypothetical protein B0H21DRAFT_740272 [Amylocystis lapponica]
MFRLLSQRNRRNSDAYLPTSSERSRNGARSPRWLTRRYTRIGFLAFLMLSVFALFRTLSRRDGDVYVYVDDPPEKHKLPPLYPEWHARELQLPQHNPNLPYPEGRYGKYLWIPNHVHASGWGNAMQELLMNAFLAYSSGRSFVFDNYTWNREGPDYTDYNGHLIPSRIPLSALITGPTVGDPFPEGDPAPRSVAKEYWDEVCPHPTILHTDVISHAVDSEASALTLLQKGVEVLNGIEEGCVEFDITSWQLFSIWVFGNTRVLDIFPFFAKSPIISQFGWSPLIEAAFDNNRPIFSPTSMLGPYLPYYPFSKKDDKYAPIPGLLVLHIRRGDFEGHCVNLAKWAATYTGFNSFVSLPDHFTPPARDVGCFPSIDQIVTRIEEVRRTTVGQGLKNVYVMTNGDKEWVAELKATLLKTGYFKRVSSSRDVKLNWEQKYVSQSVDMLIGQRAQVLIGNGFSSLTANIVMLRMAKDVPPETNRYW